MIKVKAKDRNDWGIWHYGVMESPGVLRCEGRSIPVITRTVCEDTGVTCKGVPIYEDDWLELEGNGETHRFLVVHGETGFRACEDEETAYNLRVVAGDETCRIAGNIYD